MIAVILVSLLSLQDPEKPRTLRGKLEAWRKSVSAQAPSPNPDHDPAKDKRKP